MGVIDIVKANEIVLERVQYALSKGVGRNTLDSMSIDNYIDFMSNNLVNRLEFDILSHKMLDDKYTFQLTFKYPATWFQYLKQDKFPKWFIKKYPVKYKTETRKKSVKFSRYSTYPKANLAIQNNESLYVELGSFETIKDVIYEN